MNDFYGNVIEELKLKDGSLAHLGDLIRWYSYDDDDNTTWTLTGVYRSNKVIYLGGGIDFGMAIGKEIAVSDVINQSKNNDGDFVGVEKIGKVSEIANHIKNFKNNS
jgi:hypothetical protein